MTFVPDTDVTRDFSPSQPPPPLRIRERRTRPPIFTGFLIVVASLLNLSLVAGTAWVFDNRQRAIDQVTVWNYDPSEAVAGYLERTPYTELGEFLLLASSPVVLDAERFDGECGDHREEGVGILGCYIPREQRIILFDITDERLDGMEEVVAAHEMMHAAWHRLGGAERAELGAMLEAEAAELSADEAFAARMEVYARTEPGQRQNELHSIIATEIAEVSPALEEYFALYFTDRQFIVQLHVSSNAVRVALRERSEAVVAELTALGERIEADYATYTSASASLAADVGSFNARASSGGFTSQAEFDRARAALVARQSTLNANFAAIEESKRQYDALREELVLLDAQAAELNRSINIAPREDTGL